MQNWVEGERDLGGGGERREGSERWGMGKEGRVWKVEVEAGATEGFVGGVNTIRTLQNSQRTDKIFK